MQFDKIMLRSTYLSVYRVPVRPMPKRGSNRGTWDERGKDYGNRQK
jgi:hypothetical protein